MRLGVTRAKRRHGFTLTELLVTIAVISVLATLLLSVIGTIKNRARSVNCVNNVRQLGLAYSLYVADSGIPFNADRIWINFLRDYYGKSRKIMICPATREDEIRRGTNLTWTTNWLGKADMPYRHAIGNLDSSVGSRNIITGYDLGSYAMNMWMHTVETDPEYFPRFFRNESAILTPNLTIVFSDGFQALVHPLETDPPGRDLYQLPISHYSGMENLTMARHGRRPTARQSTPIAAGTPLGPWRISLFAYDGHVEQASLDTLWNYSWHRTWVRPAERPK